MVNIRKLFDVDYKMSTRSILAWFWRSSKGIRGKAVANCIVGMLSVSLDFLFIWSTKLTIDIATGKSTEPFWLGASLIILVMAAEVILSFANRWIYALLGVRSKNLMQLRVFSRLMHSQWNGKERLHSGDTMNRLITDSNTVTDVLTDTVPSLLCVLYRLIGAFIFLYSMEPLIALLLVAVTPLTLLLSKLYINKMRALSREVRDTESTIQSILQESIQHRMVLKTLEQTTGMVDRLSSTQSSLRSQIRHRTKFSSVSSLIVNTGFAVGYLLTFIWCAWRLQSGVITYGMMLAFVQLVGQIQGPFKALTGYIPTIVNAFTSAERIMELEEAPLEAEGDPILFPDGAGIRFQDVSFRYHDGHHDILSHFSFDFRPGSTTAVVGETGNGKTTLLRLILALLRPTSGTVTFYPPAKYPSFSPLLASSPSPSSSSPSSASSASSAPLREPTSPSLSPVLASPRTRCNLVYVPQGNSLLSGTIRDNLLLGDPDASDEEMRVALMTACADFVFRSEEGLDLPCGEGGEGLSEGQAQRIAIARALLRQGNVLLLDEATSALDATTESRLISNLSLQAKARCQTVIYITHRQSALSVCDHVIRLEKPTDHPNP